MENKHIIITGGSGRIGRYVIRDLMDKFNLINFDRISGSENTDFIKGDVMDLDALREATKGAHAIIHLAALDLHTNADPEKFVHVNTMGTWNVLQSAKENGVKKVILCSSISACGLSEMRPDWKPLYLPVDEYHECKPVHAYSVSKQIIEQMAQSFLHGTDMSVICLRPVAVVMAENLNWYIESVDDPNRHWLFYYVTAKDVARAFHMALEVTTCKWGVFFLSADDTSRPEKTLEWYEKEIGCIPPISNPNIFHSNPRASIFSNAKAFTALGWRPTSNFNEMRKYALNPNSRIATGL